MGEMASKVNSYQDTNVSISPPSTPIVDTGMVRLGSDNPGDCVLRFRPVSHSSI